MAKTPHLAFLTGDDSAQLIMANWLHEMGRTIDILEPMERINSALKMLCGEVHLVPHRTRYRMASL